MPANAPHMYGSASVVLSLVMIERTRDLDYLREYVRSHLTRELGELAYHSAQIVKSVEDSGGYRYTARINILTDEQLHRIIEWHVNAAIDRHTLMLCKASKDDKRTTEDGSDAGQ